jgi:excisionase family DNA binding protein
MNEILTSEEAAEYLRMKPKSIERLARRKEIRASKVGGKWKFKKEALVEHLDSTENIQEKKEAS